MTLKSTLVFTLLLAMAAFSAMADDQTASATLTEVGVHVEAAPAPAGPEIVQSPQLGELSLELTGATVLELSGTSRTLTCEEIDGTPCTTSESCGSCYPTPSCPLTPCYCGYGVCQCDIEDI